MNLPNLLTLLRIVLTFGVIVFAQRQEPWAIAVAAFVFAVAAASDYLDGYLAKKHNLATDFGRIMDPIADKFLVLSVFFVFMRIHLIPGWMFYVTALREVLVTASRLSLMSKGQVVAAEKEGKLKTVLQMTGISLAFVYLILTHVVSGLGWWFWLTQAVLAASVAVTLYSGVTYFVNHRKCFL